MRRIFVFSIVLPLVLLVLFGLTGCGGEDDSQAVETVEEEVKQLIIGWDQDTLTLDPHRAYEMYTNAPIHAMYDTLYKFGDDLAKPIPSLATGYTVDDDVEYTFTLREGVQFSSGNPFSSKDVKFSIERVKHLNSNISFLAENIESVEAPDNTTVVLTLSKPDAAFISKIATSAFTIVDSIAAMEAGATSSADAETTDQAQDWFDENSCGTGPYMLKRFSPDVEVVLEANPFYWNGEVPFDEVILKHMPDTNTQMLMVEKGDIDIAMNLSAEQVKQVEGKEGVKVIPAPGMAITFLLMNDDPEIGGPFSEKGVRQAIKYALDYEGYQLMAGPGAVTPVGIIQAGFLGALPVRPEGFRDVAKAKKLLAEAGYPEGFSGKVYAISHAFEGLDWVKVAEKVKSDLSEINIELEVVPQELTVGLDDYRNGAWSFAVTGWGPDYPDVNNQLAFLPGEKVGLRANWVASDDPELVKLGKQALVETDIDAREIIIRKIQERMEEDSPFNTLVQHPRQVVVKDTVTGAAWHDVYKINIAQVRK